MLDPYAVRFQEAGFTVLAFDYCYFGESEFDREALKPGDITLPLDIKDRENENVFTAKITFYISYKNNPPHGNEAGYLLLRFLT
jgi:hypothetical protein